jgi:hypothetical protein
VEAIFTASGDSTLEIQESSDGLTWVIVTTMDLDASIPKNIGFTLTDNFIRFRVTGTGETMESKIVVRGTIS